MTAEKYYVKHFCFFAWASDNIQSMCSYESLAHPNGNKLTLHECPLVSVVVINHNYSQFVCDAIDSVLQQTYSNIKLFVIDDGSTDNSVELIHDTYGDSIEIIEQKNMGIVATRNKILDFVDGDYLVQLDADDYLAADFIEKMVSKASESNLQIVYCQAHYFGKVTFDTMYPEYDIEKLKHENYIVPCALYSLSFINQHRARYDSYLDSYGYEDWDFPLGLCLAGARAGLVDEPLFFYRKHLDVASRNDLQEASLLKLLLVRHHIWQKYNAQYPNEFRYFSAEIDLLLNTIRSLEEKEQIVHDAQVFKKSVYASHQWRIGGVILAPVRYVRRLLGRAK